MVSWDLAEARLVQIRDLWSGINATNFSFVSSPVPAGKIWVITGFAYVPDAAETKTINIRKVTAGGQSFGLLNPISLALNPMVASFLEQGMEHYLMPGEYIQVHRDSATAGSAMRLTMQFIEIDLPLYHYDEPQVVKRQQRALSSIRQRLGGGLGRGSMVPPTLTGGDRGGRGGPLEK